MPTPRQDRKLETELTAMLAPVFPGITITIDHSERWGRRCVTFRWEGFTELLPEERFQRLVPHLSEQFREEKLPGFVWLELAPRETIDEFLKLPRSEDVTDREAGVYRGLEQAGFFDGLRHAMRPSPGKACNGDFSHTAGVLTEKKFTPTKIRDAKLVFIRHGAYCDCQIIDTIQAELAKTYEHAK